MFLVIDPFTDWLYESISGNIYGGKDAVNSIADTDHAFNKLNDFGYYPAISNFKIMKGDEFKFFVKKNERIYFIDCDAQECTENIHVGYLMFDPSQLQDNILYVILINRETNKVYFRKYK